MNRLQRRFPDMTGTDPGFFRSSLILHSQRHPTWISKTMKQTANPVLGKRQLSDTR